MTQEIEQVLFDRSIEGIDPDRVHEVTLASGRVMPVAAFGTFHSDWAQDYMKDATVEAIRLGWRHIDTARAYENEDVVGEAIRESIEKGYIASADELFITAKLWNGHMDPKDVAPALDNTLKALGVEKVDLYLNHWPWPNVHTPGCAGDHTNPDAVPYIHEDFLKTWEEIIKLKKAGKIVDVGTSNHTEATMKLLLRDVAEDERPVVNQMEMHPLFSQNELRRYFESEGVVCTGYMAMGSPNRPSRDSFKEHRNDMQDPTLLAIAKELGVVPPAVCLAWAVQRENKSGGFVAMATRSDWIKSNLESATRDLLSQEQLVRLCGDGTPGNDGIDANNRLIWGQVFLWEEADGDWRVLWDDSQVFETQEGYEMFKTSWAAYHAVQLETTFQRSVMKERIVSDEGVDANAFSLNFDQLASRSKVNGFVDDMRSLPMIDSQASFNEVCKEVCRLWGKHYPHGHNGSSAEFKRLDLIISSGAVENEVILTQWGGVVVTSYQHPEVEKFLVIRQGGYLALEKHDEKDEQMEVLEGAGVLLYGDGAKNILSVHELHPGDTFHFEPGVEHCVIGTEDLLIFERSTDPKGMDQDLIFIYTPEEG